ncbi:MAG: hypothetical protein Q7S09_02170 [bacterium]|nr:hypothetical protein [bacterium]
MSRASRFVFALTFAVLAVIRPVSAEELYVANFGNGTVSHVVTNGSKVTNIAVGGGPRDVVSTADGAYIYIAQQTIGGIAVIRTSDNAVLSGIATPSSPTKIAIGNSDTRLYVANNTLAAPHVTIVNISPNPNGTRANVVIGSIDLSSQGASFATTVATFGSFLAIGTESGHVFLYDTSTSPVTLLANRTIGVIVKHISFAPGGTKLYVILGSYIDAIDGDGNPTLFGNVHVLEVSSLVVKTVLGAGLNELQYGGIIDGLYLYITSIDGNLFSVDAATDTLLNTLFVGSQLAGFATTDRKLYAANPAENLVQTVVLGRTPVNDRVDGSTVLPLGSSPLSVAVLPPAPKGKGKP